MDLVRPLFSSQQLVLTFLIVLRAAVSPWKDHLPDEQGRTPLVMARFHSEQDIRDYTVGCDADIGGYSTVNLTLDEESRGEAISSLPFLP